MQLDENFSIFYQSLVSCTAPSFFNGSKMKANRLIREVVKCTCAKREFNTLSGVPHKFRRPLSTSPQVKPKPVEEVQKTGLYDLHVDHKGKMVNFAGFYLPIQYEDASISASHLHTRSNCSIFDVSHMLQTYVRGKHAVEFIESLCVTDVAGMKPGRSALSLYINDGNGGIIDDLIVTKISDDTLYIVSNASRQTIDKELLLDRLQWFKSNGKDVNVEFLDSSEQSLIAIQGPKTAGILQPYVNIEMENLHFMTSSEARVGGVENCRITRCGYTGEDGVEISVPSNHVKEVVNMLLQNEFVKLAGLGARDTLRLEAGLCLHGNDIDETTTPVEAGLTWTIGKRRKTDLDFPGHSTIMHQIKNGTYKKRIGLIKVGGAPARQGCKIIGFNDEVVGLVTSGCPAPSLGVNVAMGYVQTSYAKSKTDVRVNIRDNLHNATVSKMPFVEAKYFVKPKSSK